MKEDEYPKCWYQDDNGVWSCYVMESKDPEHLDIDERFIDGCGYEVTETCRICGECDVYYPV